jgi:hypothetical protein
MMNGKDLVVVVPNSKVLSLQSRGGTEENREKPPSG